MQRTTFLALLGALLFLVAPLAGCVSPADDLDASSTPDDLADALPLPPTDADFASIVVNDHDHDDTSLHVDHAGLDLVGFDTLTEDLAPWAWYSGYSEPDVHGDLAVVASVEGNRAFTLVDVSDPADPEVLSHFYSWGENWDARFSDDGRFVFVGCQGGTPGGAYTQATGVGACIAPEGHAPQDTVENAVMAVDITDPEDPELVAWTPSGSIHNLETTTLDDGTVLVATSAGDLLEYLPDEERFELLTNFDARHDVSFGDHPETGVTYMFTGTQDLTIYDVSTPRDPEIVGALDPQELPEGVTAWHEQSPSPTLVDGRWILAGAGEDSAGIPGTLTIFDITDPASIEVRGTWTLPGGPYTEQGSYKFSLHNIDVNADGQVAVAMYHAGVWVLDASTQARQDAPVTLAAYQPHEERLNPPMATPYGAFVNVPYVWGAQWHADGHLVVPDMNTGLYVLESAWPVSASASVNASAT